MLISFARASNITFFRLQAPTRSLVAAETSREMGIGATASSSKNDQCGELPEPAFCGEACEEACEEEEALNALPSSPTSKPADFFHSLHVFGSNGDDYNDENADDEDGDDDDDYEDYDEERKEVEVRVDGLAGVPDASDSVTCITSPMIIFNLPLPLYFWHVLTEGIIPLAHAISRQQRRVGADEHETPLLVIAQSWTGRPVPQFAEQMLSHLSGKCLS